MKLALKLTAFAACASMIDAHSMMIRPKPRNAMDSELPEWKDG